MSKNSIQSNVSSAAAAAAAVASAPAGVPADVKSQRAVALPPTTARARRLNFLDTLAAKLRPLAKRDVRASQAKARNLDQKLPAKVRGDILRFTQDTQEGLLPPRAVSRFAREIALNGFCAPKTAVQINEIAAKAEKSLTARIDLFDKTVKATTHLDHGAQMKYVASSTRKEINNERKAWNTIKKSFAYCNEATSELQEMATLSNKLQKNGKLPKKEMDHLAATLWKYKETMPVLAQHLAQVESKMPEGSGASQLARAALSNLADNHLALADLMTLYSDHLPPSPPLSREQRIAYHLTEAKGARAVFARILAEHPNSSAALKTRLGQIDKKLAAHQKMIETLKTGQLPEQTKNLESMLDVAVGKEVKFSKSDRALVKQKLLAAKKMTIVKGVPHGQVMKLYIEAELERMPEVKDALPNASRLLARGRSDGLNQESWSPLRKDIKFKIGGIEHKVHSTIRPAGEHSAKLATPYAGGGVNSTDRLQYDHAVNLAATTLHNSAGEKLFSAHRSGVIDPYQMVPKHLAQVSDFELTKMLDKLIVAPGLREGQTAAELRSTFRSDKKEARALASQMRTQAAHLMATDTVATMILNDPKKLHTALLGRVVDLPITSISLMTPDYLRELGTGVGEQSMLKTHTQALRNLAGAPISLTMHDKHGQPWTARVRVRPEVVNFAVNAFALRSVGVLGGNHVPLWKKLMGWQLVAPANQLAIEGLVGRTGRLEVGGRAAVVLSQLQEQRATTFAPQEVARLDKQINKITQLSTQIKTIWREKSFVREARDPYKMPTRLALLVDALGENPLFHCKSGKDRTGQVDGEAKYLASVFDATGKFPAPSVAPSSENKIRRTQFALNTGNLEVQAYNAGMPGYKLRGVPALNDQFLENQLAQYRGGSDFVKA